jgi:hypothetical protein
MNKKPTMTLSSEDSLKARIHNTTNISHKRSTLQISLYKTYKIGASSLHEASPASTLGKKIHIATKETSQMADATISLPKATQKFNDARVHGSPLGTLAVTLNITKNLCTKVHYKDNDENLHEPSPARSLQLQILPKPLHQSPL